MKKTHWPARLAAGCLVTPDPGGRCLCRRPAGEPERPAGDAELSDSESHPIHSVPGGQQAHGPGGGAEEAALRRGRRLCQGGGGQAGDLSGRSSVQPSGASYQVVNLSAGQTITGGAACEFLLRSGTATCVSDTSPGLVDMTAGTTLAGGGALTANHLYLATIEGRGVRLPPPLTLLVGDLQHSINRRVGGPAAAPTEMVNSSSCLKASEGGIV